ncbi:MAG: endolytic transglycosylase MltG [Patescibacteria group bacterium]
MAFLFSKRLQFFCCAVLTLLFILYALFVAPTVAYPTESVVHVDSGSSISEVGSMLVEHHVLATAFGFKLFSSLLGGVQAGTYALHARQTSFMLAYRMARGLTELTPLRVTIPEGSTVRDMGERLELTLMDFDAPAFVHDATQYEGYLFPETYFFLPGSPPEVVIRTMRDEYEKNILPLRPQMASSSRSESDIIIMASLLEREARKPETKKIVSGILWKRIDLGMPLQVDAVFGYIHATTTYSPTFEELEIDSPYNTYRNKGLPPGPINAPGLESILAALEPTKTPYLYYLTGADGTMHYARTFEEHIANRRFLR